MVILKKIKGSTLMETLVATVIIIAVFMIAALILNNLFANTMKNRTHHVKTQMNELEYLYIHHKLELPYSEEFDDWNITLESFKMDEQTQVEIEAFNPNTNKTITHKLFEVQP